MHKKHLFSQNPTKKRIFVRADLNVPLTPAGQVRDDAKLRAILPTLEYLRSRGAAQIILASHLGRPDATAPDLALSTRLLLPWFVEHGLPIAFCANFSSQPTGPLVLLENLRFFTGEHAEPSLAFAQQLANMADIFVIDAFGTLHRHDASVCLVPTLFAPESRSYGLCVAHELEHLSVLKECPKKPFVVLLGGSKVADKLSLLAHWVAAAEANRPSNILLGGLLGKAIASQRPELPGQAAARGITLIMPIDYTLDASGAPIDIGPETIKKFIACLATAKTTFANGTMGKYEDVAGQKGTQATLAAMATNTGVKIIGGGDCGAAVHHFGLEAGIDFISTGGGATLAYLAAQEAWTELPGLKALLG